MDLSAPQLPPLSLYTDLDPAALQRAAQPGADGTSPVLGEAFESILLRQFLGQAMQPLLSDALPESGPGADLYRDLLTDTLATSMAQAHDFGFSNLQQARLQSPPQV